MTQFCESCPMRGEIYGDIINLFEINEVHTQVNSGEWAEISGNTNIGVLVDEEYNISEPFLLPDDNSDVLERIERRLVTCENRDLSGMNLISRFIKSKKCPALGQLAIQSNPLKKEVIRYTKAQLL